MLPRHCPEFFSISGMAYFAILTMLATLSSMDAALPMCQC